MTGVPDIVGPNLRVLFCGINPGMRSGQLGQHFARPGNRFWKLLAASGLTDRLVIPAEQDHLLGYGLGITNIVEANQKQPGRSCWSDTPEGVPGCISLTGVRARVGSGPGPPKCLTDDHQFDHQFVRDGGGRWRMKAQVTDTGRPP